MSATLLGLLLAFIGFIWWAAKNGKRNGIFFFLPYIVFFVDVLLFVVGINYFNRNNPELNGGMEILIYIAGIIEFLAFLLEFFIVQPKCSGCKRRLGMSKIGESDHNSNNYIGTKTYKVKSRSGETIGEYEGAVSRTDIHFTAHYTCRYCGIKTYLNEVSTYDNE